MSRESIWSPRNKKVLYDIKADKGRLALVLLSMTLGMIGFSAIVNTDAVAQRELSVNYQQTNPASFVVTADGVTPEEVQRLAARPDVGDIQTRQQVSARILKEGGSQWARVYLWVLEDYEDIRLNKFFEEDGSFAPEEGTVVFERRSTSLAQISSGTSITLLLPGSEPQTLTTGGLVHNPGLAPADQDRIAYGYITPETLVQLGGEPQQNQLYVQVVDTQADKQQVESTAASVIADIEKSGAQVVAVNVPEPGAHPHQWQLSALLYLLKGFGLVAMILSAIITSNVTAALLSGQVRQIGVMKSIGATSRQVAAMYLSAIAVIAVVSLVIGMPLGALLARGFIDLGAQILNFDVFDYSVPLWTYTQQVLVGLGLPLLVAGIPIFKGSSTTVREAIDDYGVAEPSEVGWFDDTLPKLGFGRPLIISLRNTVRKRGRFVVTLIALASSGVAFILAVNVFASMNKTVADKFDAVNYDTFVTYSTDVDPAQVNQIISATPNVSQVETWGGSTNASLSNDGRRSNRFGVYAPPGDTELVAAFPLVDGRWLQPDDTNKIVVNHALVAMVPDLKVGEDVTLVIDGDSTEWEVVGVVKEMLSPPSAYVNFEPFTALTGDETGRFSAIQTHDKSGPVIAATTVDVERRLQDSQVAVKDSQQNAQWRILIEEHLVILGGFLLGMSFISLTIGGLAVVSTMSMNVMERRREFGVLRAIGAPTRSLFRLVIIEGMIIGAVSWLIAVGVAGFASRYVAESFGQNFFEAPLSFSYSLTGVTIWLAVSIGFGAVASLAPARTATKLTVRSVLESL